MAANLSDEDRQLWNKRINAAEADRAKVEPVWMEALAFAKGLHWVKYAGPNNRRLVTIANPRRLERETVDELTQYRLTLLGELSLDDDRPQVLFRQDEAPSEDYAEQANDILPYAWDEEIRADDVLLEARMTLIDLGTAPVRCRFDPEAGLPVPDPQPFVNGALVSTQDAIRAMDAGQKVDLRQIREGRIVWEAGTPFNVLVPPGVPREDDFQWIVWVSVGYLPDLEAKYPGAGLTADTIQSVATLSTPAEPGSGGSAGDQLGDHVLIYTCYTNPSKQYPDGQVVVLGGKQKIPLEVRPKLDYVAPDGTARSGVHFFHAIRLTDRFWSRGFMELGISPQRALNRRKTQIAATIDRGQPYIVAQEGALPKNLPVLPQEILWLKPGAPQPQHVQGNPPGPWMQADVEAHREDLSRAVLPDIALGDTPQNTPTYSALALLKEQAGRRLDAIMRHQKTVVEQLCEDTLYDIRRYWGTKKRVALAGTEGKLRAFDFDATQLPDYTKVEFARGAAKPRSQAAQLQLIQDIWGAAVASTVVLANPPAWIDWYTRSLQAGKPMDLPQPPVDAQYEKAAYENEKLADGSVDVQAAVGMVDYFDNHALHISEHRQIQSHARLMGRDDIFVLCEAHIKEHERQALLNTMQAMSQQPPQLPMPGQPPQLQQPVLAGGAQTGPPTGPAGQAMPPAQPMPPSNGNGAAPS